MKIQMVSFDRCITIEVETYEKYEEIFKWFRACDDNDSNSNNRKGN